MKFHEYQKDAWRTMRKDLSNTDQILNCALGLGEAGEVQNLVKKGIYHKHGIDHEMRERVKDELGDILWYVACMCEAIGTDLETIALDNIEKLKNRYPEGFDANKSINRTV